MVVRQVSRRGRSEPADIVVAVPVGARLPAWLHYDAGTQSFVVTDVPAGGLPLRVLVAAGGQGALATIAES